MAAHDWNVDLIPKCLYRRVLTDDSTSYGLTSSFMYSGGDGSGAGLHIEDGALFSMNIMWAGEKDAAKIWYTVS